MSDNGRFKTWAARPGDYAVFFEEDGYGNRSYYRKPVRFWREFPDGTMSGLIVGTGGIAEASKLDNFVQFQPASRRVWKQS